MENEDTKWLDEITMNTLQALLSPMQYTQFLQSLPEENKTVDTHQSIKEVARIQRGRVIADFEKRLDDWLNKDSTDLSGEMDEFATFVCHLLYPVKDAPESLQESMEEEV